MVRVTLQSSETRRVNPCVCLLSVAKTALCYLLTSFIQLTDSCWLIGLPCCLFGWGVCGKSSLAGGLKQNSPSVCSTALNSKNRKLKLLQNWGVEHQPKGVGLSSPGWLVFPIKLGLKWQEAIFWALESKQSNMTAMCTGPYLSCKSCQQPETELSQALKSQVWPG